jgi:glycosyltransferase involved in cell wall biosynthesis
MDLHPEIGVLSGQFAHPWVRRVLGRLELATCRRAHTIVVLSGDMRAALLRRDPGLAEKVVVLNNFELPDYGTAEAVSPLPPAPDRLRIVFTGNVGRFQGLDDVVRAVLAEQTSDLQLAVMGEGAAKPQLQNLVDAAPRDRADRVVLLPHGTVAEARALSATADLGLVSLMPGVIHYAYPSKTSTYLASSLPVLVVVEPDSELARMVVDEEIGFVLPRDVDGMVSALREIGADRERLTAMRARAVEVWAKQLSADEVLPRWETLLEQVVAG